LKSGKLDTGKGAEPRSEVVKRVFCTGISLLLFAIACAQTDEDRFGGELAAAALMLTRQEVIYDPAYYAIEYPNGDIPRDRGVCTDVIIRAYRAVGIDLQQEVHEDMCKHFDMYQCGLACLGK